MTIHSGDRVLVWATVKSPTHEKEPTGLWWVNVDGAAGCVAVQEKDMLAVSAHWKPIAEAPRDRQILIGDGVCWPPDVVQWRRERKAITDEFGTKSFAIPAGWFVCSGGRSRFDPGIEGHLMTAKVWCELPSYDALMPGQPEDPSYSTQFLASMSNMQDRPVQDARSSRVIGRAVPELTGEEAPCSSLCYCERGANRAEIARLRSSLKGIVAYCEAEFSASARTAIRNTAEQALRA